MTLSEEQVNILKFTLRHLDPEAKIYSFNKRKLSRIRGPVIELLIISRKVSRRNLKAIRLAFSQRFGEHEMVIIVDDGSLEDPEVASIFKKAKEL